MKVFLSAILLQFSFIYSANAVGELVGGQIKQAVKPACKEVKKVDIQVNKACDGAGVNNEGCEMGKDTAAKAAMKSGNPYAMAAGAGYQILRDEDGICEDVHKEDGMLSGLAMAATGIGGMQLAQGLSEMKSDKEAAKDMKNYLNTIKCGYGGFRDVIYDEVGHAPSETREFADAKFEYIKIAQKIKMAKESLGMAPGIESELVVDTSSLYQNRGTDQDGANSRLDTAQNRLDSNAGRNRAIAGGAIAAAGVAIGVAANSKASEKSKKADTSKGSDNFAGGGGMLGGAVGMIKNNPELIQQGMSIAGSIAVK